MIETNNSGISIRRQCELIGLNRSSLYYKPVGISDYNLLLMGIIDKQYTETPYYGIRRMTKELNNKGHKVNRKRVRRLMRLMGLEAIYPRRNLSKNTGKHRNLPVFAERSEHYTGKPGLVGGYNIYPDGERICLSCGDNRLVEPVCSVLEIIDHAGI